MAGSLPRVSFNATWKDVLSFYRDFPRAKKGPKAPELLNKIRDYALYHEHAICRREGTIRYPASNYQTIAAIYLCSPPVPPNALVFNVSFGLRSAGEGWSASERAQLYTNSHTWWDASILVPVHHIPTGPLSGFGVASNPIDARSRLLALGWDFRFRSDGEVTWRIHKNISTHGQFNNYRVEWIRGDHTPVRNPGAEGSGAGFLGLLQPGDIVVLWARANTGCTHIVDAAEVAVGYR